MKEHQHIEWKSVWRDEFLKWISGFANAEGGVLVIGRDDRGHVTGVADAKRLLAELPNKIRDLLGIVPRVNLKRVGGKDTIEIVVEPYPHPVSYRGEYHVRSGSTKQELKGAALDRFLLRKQGRHWDGVPVPKVRASALDTKALAWFRARARRSQRLPEDVLAEPDRVLLDKLHLIEGGHLKRAALLLFHPDPERFATGAYVKIGFFENNVDLRHQDEVHGGLFHQVNQTIEVLKLKYLKALISYEGLQRVETYPVPEAALREAVLNAVVHKDYASGVPVQISVYPDKLMIWNPGQLPSDWTLATLEGKHASRPFNPDVANAFFRAGMIEAWGRGIERMFAECAAARVPPPAMRYETDGLWMVFEIGKTMRPEARAGVKSSGKSSVKSSGKKAAKSSGKNLSVFERENKVKSAVKSSGKKAVKSSRKSAVKSSGKTAEQIIAVIRGKPDVTYPELAGLLGLSERSVEKQMRQIKAAGLVARVGPHRGGHWELLA